MFYMKIIIYEKGKINVRYIILVRLFDNDLVIITKRGYWGDCFILPPSKSSTSYTALVIQYKLIIWYLIYIHGTHYIIWYVLFA